MQANFCGCEGFCPNSPEKNSDLQREALHVILSAVGRHFCSYFQVFFAQIFRDFVKVFRDFAQISTNFARILRDFFPDFHQIKIFVDALAPSAPPPSTPVGGRMHSGEEFHYQRLFLSVFGQFAEI